MSLPADFPPGTDLPPPPETTPPHSLLLALLLVQIQSIQDFAARLDTLEAGHKSLQHDLHALGERLTDLSEEAQAVQSFGWDYVALVQRLNAIEQRLAQPNPETPQETPPDSPPTNPAP